MSKVPFSDDLRKVAEVLPYLARPDRIVTDSLRRLVHLGSAKVGLPPGTLVAVGGETGLPTQIGLTEYGLGHHAERENLTVAEALDPPAAEGVVRWVRVVGLQQTDVVREIGERRGVHPLVLEDVLNASHRPKFEDHDTYLFVVLKVFVGTQTPTTPLTHVCLLLFRDLVVTFHERDDHVFDVIRDRVKNEKARLRGLGPDALLHVLIDTAIDQFFPAFNAFGEVAEEIELELVDRPSNHTMRRLQQMKGELMTIRKAVAPLRDMLIAVDRSESDLLGEKTLVYFKDAQDHAVNATELTETFRDVFAVLTDLYFASVSHRTNNIVRTLTLMATIFMPLTFIAGIYGMNFEHMPELAWRYGYAGIWGIFLLVTAGLLLLFRRLHWFD
ncbi:MAG: magnesium/cobalt transporter CorA [Candidatus Sumerlaeia bacterium]|nr:magnesium/cobalt transporter CorA [Candidatus Sumerlaeia bacterium]